VPAIHELAGLPVFRCRRILFGLLPSLGEHGPRQMAALRDRLRDDWHGAPPSLLQVAISIGDMRGVEQLTYGFAPEQCGATKDEQVAHARHWADLVLPMVSRGFDHGAREGAPACR
jgi:hypothetical protein